MSHATGPARVVFFFLSWFLLHSCAGVVLALAHNASPFRPCNPRPAKTSPSALRPVDRPLIISLSPSHCPRANLYPSTRRRSSGFSSNILGCSWLVTARCASQETTTSCLEQNKSGSSPNTWPVDSPGLPQVCNSPIQAKSPFDTAHAFSHLRDERRCPDLECREDEKLRPAISKHSQR